MEGRGQDKKGHFSRLASGLLWKLQANGRPHQCSFSALKRYTVVLKRRDSGSASVMHGGREL